MGVYILVAVLAIAVIVLLIKVAQKQSELVWTRLYWLECQKNYEAVGKALDAVGPWAPEMTPVKQAEAMRDIELHRRKQQRD